MTAIDITGIVCSIVIVAFFIFMAIVMLTPAVSRKEMKRILAEKHAGRVARAAWEASR